jgi:hypothetical protein
MEQVMPLGQSALLLHLIRQVPSEPPVKSSSPHVSFEAHWLSLVHAW